MRVVFAGTPEAAVPSLRGLIASRHDVTAVVTRADAPIGRKRVLTPSPVAAEAEAHGLSILKTNRLDDEATEAIEREQPDLGVIVAYGGLVRRRLLDVPRLGWINLHFSLLPRWRGAAPVQHAIIAGDTVTGADVFQLVPELDAGDVLGELRYEITAAATAGTVLDDLAGLGAGLLVDTVDRLERGDVDPRPQTGEATLAPKLSAEDARVDWRRSAHEVSARIRGTTPEPGAWTEFEGSRLKLLDAVVADETSSLPPGSVVADGDGILVSTDPGAVRISVVQPSGKRAMPARDWLRGLRRDDVRIGS